MLSVIVESTGIWYPCLSGCYRQKRFMGSRQQPHMTLPLSGAIGIRVPGRNIYLTEVVEVRVLKNCSQSFARQLPACTIFIGNCINIVICVSRVCTSLVDVLPGFWDQTATSASIAFRRLRIRRRKYVIVITMLRKVGGFGSCGMVLGSSCLRSWLG